MSFAEWKKRNKVMDDSLPVSYQAAGYRVAKAAYKAGLRDAAKDAAKPVAQEKKDNLLDRLLVKYGFPNIRIGG